MLEALLAWGGGAAGVAVMAYLAKRMLEHNLTGELEQFKHDLKAYHEHELERLRADLRVSAHEKEVRFDRFHEKEVEVLAELYRLLARTRHAISKLIKHQVRDQERFELIDAAAKANDELHTFYVERQVFVPEDLTGELGRVMAALFLAALKDSDEVYGNRQGLQDLKGRASALLSLSQDDAITLDSLIGEKVDMLLRELRHRVRVIITGGVYDPK